MVIEQSSHAGLTVPENRSAGKQQCRKTAVPENSSAGISSAGNGQGQTALPGRCARA
jgi:hypothetical protein